MVALDNELLVVTVSAQRDLTAESPIN